MSQAEYIIKGPKPLVPLGKGSAGQQLYNGLLTHVNLPEALIDVHTQETVSYKTLLETSCRLADSLHKCGYTQNSVISVCSENNLNFFLPIIASLYLGIIVAPLNENYTERELSYYLNLFKPQLIFCSKKSIKKILQLTKKFPCIQKLIVIDSRSNVNEIESLYNFITHNSEANFNVKRFQPLKFDTNKQVALIMSSSGTTGLPKGVMVTHKNIAVRFSRCKDPMFGTLNIPNSTVLSFLPFFHGFGLCTTLAYLIIGLRIVIMKRFEPELFLSSLQNYRVQSTFVVPPVMTFLAKSPLVDKYDISSLKEICCGAATLSKNISETVSKRLSLKGIRQGYGLTETTAGIVFTPKDGYRPGSSGKLAPFSSAKVVDIDTGKSLGPKQNGELCFKGDMIMKGYLNNISATRSIIDDDGWLHTGDIGYYDQEGYFYIVNRLKELIKYKGFQVSPAELEELLMKHPNIKDAAVISIPDEFAGELPMAFVVKQAGKKLTEQEVFDYIADQVSSSKRLRGGVRFIEEIPKSVTGKIMKRALQEFAQMQKSKL